MEGTLVPISDKNRSHLDQQRSELQEWRNKADKAVIKAQIVAALASVEVMEEFQQTFRDGPTVGVDVNAWIRIGEILLSRSIPKVAAKQVENITEDAIDSVDIQAIRDSILGEFKKRSR